MRHNSFFGPNRNRYIIVLCGFALRFGYARVVTWHHLLAQVDPKGYHLLATNLLDGHGFALLNEAGNHIPNLVRTPVYPALLATVYALFGRDPTHIILFQLLLDSVNCVLIGWSTTRLAGKTAGTVAMLLYALYPNTWLFTGSVLTETVLSFSLICMLYLLLLCVDNQKKASWGLGIAVTFAILLKPTSVFLIFLVPFCAWLRTKSWRVATRIILITFLGITPWLARNYWLIGRPILSTAYIDNFNHVTAVATLFYARNEESHPFTAEWEAVYGRDLVEVASKQYAWRDPVETAADAFQRLQQVNTVAHQIVREHPTHFAKSHWDGFKRAWSPTEPYVWNTILSRYTTAEWVTAATVLFWQAVHWVALLLLPFGVWKIRRSHATLLWILGVSFGFTFVPGVLSDMRFRFPIDHLLIIVTAIGCTELIRMGKLTWKRTFLA